MLTVETRHAIGPAAARTFDTAELRRNFHVGGLFRDSEIRLIYTHYDRMIVGGAVPEGGSLTLNEVPECGTPSVLDRREMVIVNIGGPGKVTAGDDHPMECGDTLYLGMGSGPVTFAGEGRYYILSAPAHATHP
jgi:4-deoxy-L-threo-5-hexosulose-uronate ketol-isomerase